MVRVLSLVSTGSNLSEGELRMFECVMKSGGKDSSWEADDPRWRWLSWARVSSVEEDLGRTMVEEGHDKGIFSWADKGQKRARAEGRREWGGLVETFSQADLNRNQQTDGNRAARHKANGDGRKEDEGVQGRMGKQRRGRERETEENEKKEGDRNEGSHRTHRSPISPSKPTCWPAMRSLCLLCAHGRLARTRLWIVRDKTLHLPGHVYISRLGKKAIPAPCGSD